MLTKIRQRCFKDYFLEPRILLERRDGLEDLGGRDVVALGVGDVLELGLPSELLLQLPEFGLDDAGAGGEGLFLGRVDRSAEASVSAVHDPVSRVIGELPGPVRVEIFVAALNHGAGRKRTREGARPYTATTPGAPRLDSATD